MIIKYNFTPVRIAKIKVTTPNASKHMEQLQLGRSTTTVLYKVNIHLTYDPAFLCLSINSRNIKTYVHKKICIRMFIENPNVY